MLGRLGQSSLIYTSSKGFGLDGFGLAAAPAYKLLKCILVSTAIGLRKYRIPSDLRSQAQYRSVSTMVGDHMGIPGVVVFVFAYAESESGAA